MELSEDQMQVSFAEYSLFYRALLQKRPIILRSLLIEKSEDQKKINRRYRSPREIHIELSEDQMQVSFVEYSLFYRALLQKRPIILKIKRRSNAGTAH